MRASKVLSASPLLISKSLFQGEPEPVLPRKHSVRKIAQRTVGHCLIALGTEDQTNRLFLTFVSADN